MIQTKKEIKILTNHWDQINPRSIKDYLTMGGYESLKKFLFEMTSEEALFEIEKSGLVGRGGAGFSTGKKMRMAIESLEKIKYFICNLDESEPGNWKDRLLAGKNPHLLLEGIILEALIIGAKKAIIYINGNFEKQKELLEFAVSEAIQHNFLGKKILGSKYSLEVDIFSGAGAYICGEETALINSLEGNRGEPKARPPYPTEKGFLGKPTVINNAETVSNLPWIIQNDGEAFSQIGSQKSPGTKLFCLSGRFEKPGVYEVPTGITLEELVEKYGGGIELGKKLWFLQLGGASGRLVLPKEMKTKLEYDPEAEFPLGAGSVLAVTKEDDIKELLLSWTDFFRRESCGKCIPCREGTFRLWEIMKRFQDGKISEADQKAIPEIIWTLENTSFCPLGKFSAQGIKDAVEKLKILCK